MSSPRIKGEFELKRMAVLVSLMLAALIPGAASADAPSVAREMTCVDANGAVSTFTGQFVVSFAPMWRSVSESGAVGFFWQGVTVVDPDGTVVSSFSNTQGIERHFELVTCNFTIPIGPNQGREAYLAGFFIPAD